MVEFTDIRVFRMKNSDGKIRAFVNVTIDGEFVVHGIKVMENEKGLWVAMPSQRSALGEYNDIFHPITKEARVRLIEAVVSAYQRSSGGGISDVPRDEGEGSEATKALAKRLG